LKNKLLKYNNKNSFCSNILKLIFIFSVINLSILPKAFSNFNYYKLTIEDGLPSETVWSCIQDTLGYLWLGTANGLCRFDGKSLEVYKTK